MKFLLLAGLVGAFQAVSPDRWFPLSIHSWKRGWGFGKTLGALSALLALHLLAGAALYFVLAPWLAAWGEGSAREFWILSGVVILGCMIVRRVRFARMREVFGLSLRGPWGILPVLSLLGPAEALLPLFIRAKQVGGGYLLPFLAFAGGTWLVSIGLGMSGRLAWNRPFWLPRGLAWAERQLSLAPAALGLVAGFALYLSR